MKSPRGLFSSTSTKAGVYKPYSSVSSTLFLSLYLISDIWSLSLSFSMPEKLIAGHTTLTMTVSLSVAVPPPPSVGVAVLLTWVDDDPDSPICECSGGSRGGSSGGNGDCVCTLVDSFPPAVEGLPAGELGGTDSIGGTTRPLSELAIGLSPCDVSVEPAGNCEAGTLLPPIPLPLLLLLLLLPPPNCVDCCCCCDGGGAAADSTPLSGVLSERMWVLFTACNGPPGVTFVVALRWIWALAMLLLSEAIDVRGGGGGAPWLSMYRWGGGGGGASNLTPPSSPACCWLCCCSNWSCCCRSLAEVDVRNRCCKNSRSWVGPMEFKQ